MVVAHKVVNLPKGKRAFFCGDVHGDMDALFRAIKKTGFKEQEDFLFFVGDVVDRGPSSAEMIEYVTCTPGVYCTLGNHERMFLDALTDPMYRETYIQQRYGGAWIERFSETELNELAELIMTCMSIAITVQTEQHSIGVIHAQAPDVWSDVEHLSETKEVQWLWSRSQYESIKTHITKGVDAVVHGHMCDVMAVKGNHIYIDTLHRTGELTMMEFDNIISCVEEIKS